MRSGTPVPSQRQRSLWINRLAPLGLLTAVSWLGTVTAPALVTANPLALVGLSPRLPFLVVAAATTPFPLFFVIGLARLVVADPVHYAIGRDGHEWLLRRTSFRWANLTTFVGRAGAVLRRRGLLLVALRPNGLVLTTAGAAGLPARSVAAADVFGTTTYLALVWLVGRAVSPDQLEDVVATSRGLVLAIAAAALIAGAHRVLAGRRRPAGVGAGLVAPAFSGAEPGK